MKRCSRKAFIASDASQDLLHIRKSRILPSVYVTKGVELGQDREVLEPVRCSRILVAAWSMSSSSTYKSARQHPDIVLFQF